MGARTTFRLLRQIDLAWNARRWDEVAKHLADEFVAIAFYDQQTVTKAEYLVQSIALCRQFPDATLHSEAPLELFASHDGTKSASVSRLTATDRGTGRAIALTVAVISRWAGRRIVFQRQFPDDLKAASHIAGSIKSGQGRNKP